MLSAMEKNKARRVIGRLPENVTFEQNHEGGKGACNWSFKGRLSETEGKAGRRPSGLFKAGECWKMNSER